MVEHARKDCKTSTKSSSIEVVKVRVADIVIPDGWRSINEKAVDSLADSMSTIGLKTPITVRINSTGIRLDAGRHRLEAAKKLGWTHIAAIVTHDDKLDRQLWHYAENLDRVDLTALERAEAVASRAKLATKRAAQDAHPGGRQPHDKGVTKAAKAIGTTRDNVRRSKAIANLPSAVKEAARDAGLVDNETALLKVAKEQTQEDQVRKVRELEKRTRAPKPDLSAKERRQLKLLKRAFTKASEFRRAWQRASKIVRDRFIVRIRKLAPSV